MNIKYVVFNDRDKVISVHQKYVDKLSKIRSDLSKAVLCLDDVDLSPICSMSELKKDAVIIGIWEFNLQEMKKIQLTELMVRFLKKEVIKSDSRSNKEIYDLGLMPHDYFIDTLSRYNITFEQFLSDYEEMGKSLKKEREIEELADAEKFSLRRSNIEKSDEYFAGASFSLPAISGKMGEAIYYAVQVPMGQMVQLFKFNDESMPVELRSQRVLNKKRGEAIGEYLIARPLDYTLPALTASVSSEMMFVAAEGYSNVGTIQIPIDANLVLNDGAHRKYGIECAIKKNPLIKSQNITIVLFYDKGLQSCQQIFADINNFTVKPQKALSILFDQNNRLNNLVVEVIDQLLIRDSIEFEKANPGSKSNKTWSVTAIKKSIEILTGINEDKAKSLTHNQFKYYKQLVVCWFDALLENVPGDLKKSVQYGDVELLAKLRANKVTTHTVFLHSLALASSYIVKPYKDQLNLTDDSNILGECSYPEFNELISLVDLDINKNADIWKDRIVKSDLTMNPTANGVKLGAYVLLNKFKITIPSNIQAINDLVFS